MLEELGELTKEYVQNNYDRDGGKLNYEYAELYDLMALVYAYYLYLEWQRYGIFEYETIDKFYESTTKRGETQ